MHVWNPQLEQHLESVDNDDDSSTEAITRNDCEDDDDDKVDDCNLHDNNDSSSKHNDDTHEIPQPSSSQMKWIAGIGCFLGGAAVSLLVNNNGVVVMLFTACIMAVKWLFVWRRKQQMIHVKQQNKKEYHACRLKLSCWLGSIGAPPLQQQTELDNGQLDDHGHDNDWKTVLNFCQAHVDLLKQVDISLEILQTAVSMSLRSTQRVVQRVELGMLNRNNNIIILPTARRLLCQVMMNQYHSFTTTIWSEDDCGGLQVPSVISLAWLKSLRKELAEMLSLAVSQLTSYPKDMNTNDLSASTATVKESIEYLASMFTLPSPLVDLDFHTLYRQFDKASVALWAAFQSSCDTDGNYENTNLNDTRVLEFLEYVETLLHSVYEVKQRRLTNSSTQAEDSTSDHLIPTEKGTTDDSEMNHTVDTGDLEHSGSAFERCKLSNSAKGGNDSNKTLVFAGSGSVPRAPKTDAGTTEVETTVPSTKYFVSQGLVLEELQHRLAQLDPVDEVDENGNEVLNQVTNESAVRQKEPVVRTTSMLLGLSNDLLSELKNNIDNQDSSSAAAANSSCLLVEHFGDSDGIGLPKWHEPKTRED